MKYALHQDLITGRYTTTLLGGEFANCHGQGGTPEGAVTSLKLTLRVRRKNREREKNEQES